MYRLPMRQYSIMKIAARAFLAALCLLVPLSTLAENPRWIWHPNKGQPIRTNETRYFRKTFRVDQTPRTATLSVSADDEAVVYLNGREIAKCSNFKEPARETITEDLQMGE